MSERLIISKDWSKAFIAVDVTDEQMKSIEIYNKCVPAIIPGIGSAKVAHYKIQLGGSFYTSDPISLKQIRLYCPEFWLENFHGMGLARMLLPGLSRHGESAELVVRPGPPYVKPGLTWKDAWNFSLEAHIHSENSAVVNYEAEGINYTSVSTHPRNLVPGFSQWITQDETGLFQTPSEEVLERRLIIARERAANLTNHFSDRFRRSLGPARKPYEGALTAARNIAKRMGKEEIPEAEFFTIYDNAWNAMLQSGLETILPEMRHNVSAILAGQKGLSGHFKENVSEDLELILDLLSQGKITLDDGTRRQLGEVMVLNRQLGYAQQDALACNVRDNIEGYQLEIDRLNSKIEELRAKTVKDQQSITGVEAGIVRAKDTIDSNLRRRLTAIGVNEVNTLIASVKPDEVEIFDPDNDNLPF